MCVQVVCGRVGDACVSVLSICVVCVHVFVSVCVLCVYVCVAVGHICVKVCGVCICVCECV